MMFRTRHIAFTAALVVALAQSAAWQSEAAGSLQSVKFTLPWAYQGDHAFWSEAIDNGTFRKLGLDVHMDRGYGSGDAIVKVAAGAYDICFADVNAMIKFDAEHPDQHLIDVYQVLDTTPNAIITLKRTGIKQPADLDGRKIGAPPADSSRLMFPIFAQLNHVDAKSIRWQSVAPNLRETELVQGQLDAITGDTTTSIFNLLAAGIKHDDIVSMAFAKYGLDLYGSAVIVRSDYLKAHPDIVKAFVQGTIAGEIATIKNPGPAMQTLKNRDPLFDTTLEKARLGMALEDNILTPSVKSNGLGYVDPARMKRTIETNSQVYGFKNTPAPSEVYTTALLPPQSQRMPPKWSSE